MQVLSHGSLGPKWLGHCRDALQPAQRLPVLAGPFPSFSTGVPHRIGRRPGALSSLPRNGREPGTTAHELHPADPCGINGTPWAVPIATPDPGRRSGRRWPAIRLAARIGADVEEQRVGDIAHEPTIRWRRWAPGPAGPRRKLDELVKLRVYAICDEDEEPWIGRECPAPQYVGIPFTPDGDQYFLATWDRNLLIEDSF